MIESFSPKDDLFRVLAKVIDSENVFDLLVNKKSTVALHSCEGFYRPIDDE